MEINGTGGRTGVRLPGNGIIMAAGAGACPLTRSLVHMQSVARANRAHGKVAAIVRPRSGPGVLSSTSRNKIFAALTC
jgi:hypothetical protein